LVMALCAKKYFGLMSDVGLHKANYLHNYLVFLFNISTIY